MNGSASCKAQGYITTRKTEALSAKYIRWRPVEHEIGLVGSRVATAGTQRGAAGDNAIRFKRNARRS